MATPGSAVAKSDKARTRSDGTALAYQPDGSCPECCEDTPPVGGYFRAESVVKTICLREIPKVYAWFRCDATCTCGTSQCPLFDPLTGAALKVFRYGGLCWQAVTTPPQTCIALEDIPPASFVIDQQQFGPCVDGPSETECTGGPDLFAPLNRLCNGGAITPNPKVYLCIACIWRYISFNNRCPVYTVNDQGTNRCAIPDLTTILTIDQLPSGYTIIGEDGECEPDWDSCCHCLANLTPEAGCDSTPLQTGSPDCDTPGGLWTCVIQGGVGFPCCCRLAQMTGVCEGQSSRVFTSPGFENREERTYNGTLTGGTWTVNWTQKSWINGVLQDDFSGQITTPHLQCEPFRMAPFVPFYLFYPTAGSGWSGSGARFYSCIEWTETGSYGATGLPSGQAEVYQWTSRMTVALNPGNCEGVDCLPVAQPLQASQTASGGSGGCGACGGGMALPSLT